MTIRREAIGSVQNFWIRYQELYHNLDGKSVYLPDDMMFARLLKAINAPSQSRLETISRLDCRSQEHTVDNLRQVVELDSSSCVDFDSTSSFHRCDVLYGLFIAMLKVLNQARTPANPEHRLLQKLVS